MRARDHAKDLLSLILPVLLLAGCAGTPPPIEQLTAGNLAVRQADEAGARRHAPLEFHTAEKKLEKARAAMEKKDHDLARHFAEQAETDAELAQAKARSIKAEAALNELKETIRTLREEIDGAGQS